MELKQPINPELIDEYYAKWIKLGWYAAGRPYQGSVDPEKLIVETTHIGRYEGRLFKAMLTWVRDYNDLINVQKLLHYINDADQPVLGAVVEIAASAAGALPRMKAILKRCQPLKDAEVLFKETDEFGVYERNQKEFSKKEYLKWGLYCTMTEFYEDAMYNRHYVLMNNPLLAIRALIGPNIRSEILFELEHRSQISITALKEHVGYAYSAVYTEVMNLIRNGYLSNETNGKKQMITMKKPFAKYLKSIPV
ncbi:MAG: hypothetical protein LBI42_09645 [Chitinispirillales bacterium]|nr:hypothetical protein [Chitinispirillales bacterium]